MKFFKITIELCLCYFCLLNQINARYYLSPNHVDNELKCDSIDSKICLNGGICADWSKLLNIYGRHEVCVCQTGFYGPHCEFVDEHEFLKLGSRKRRFWYRNWSGSLQNNYRWYFSISRLFRFTICLLIFMQSLYVLVYGYLLFKFIILLEINILKNLRELCHTQLV